MPPEINIEDLTKLDIDDYIIQGYQIEYIFEKIDVSKYHLCNHCETNDCCKFKEIKQYSCRKCRCWTLENTKGLFKSMLYTWDPENICLLEKPFLEINDKKEYKISCGLEGCKDCIKWYEKKDWKTVEKRLLLWENELQAKEKNKRGRKRKLVEV
jgi:hypothetical protein